MAREHKKGFVLYYDYRNHLALLRDEERGRLLMALLDYSESGKEPDLEGAALMAYSFIRAQMDRDAAKYAQTVQKRREAGKQGGRPPKTSESNEKQNEAKKANGFLEKQNKAKKPDTVTDTVTDTDTDTDINTPPISPTGGTPSDAQERRFAEFWAEYPKKVGKKAALAAWKRLKPDAELFERIMQAVTSAKNSEQWNREGGRYIPNPATWINQGRWDDEMQPKGEQSKSGSFDTDSFFEAALRRSYAQTSGSNSPRAALEREAIKRSEENAKNPPKTAGNDEAIKAKMEALKERLG